MFVSVLSRLVEGWKDDVDPFIQIPLLARTISRGSAYKSIRQIAELVKAEPAIGTSTVGFCFEDPVSWCFATIAIQISGAVAVPIPREFTGKQISSFVPSLDFVLTDSRAIAVKLSARLGARARIEECEIEGVTFYLTKNSGCPRSAPDFPADTVGVIHTSGSTDNPKGVIISGEGLLAVIDSMAGRLNEIGPLHYASVLPMSLLLEQILGIYLPLFTQGTVAVLPATVPCYTGTQGDLNPYLSTIKESHADFSMVPPSFLSELRKMAKKDGRAPRDFLGNALRLLATGGAPIEDGTLEYFRENQIEVFQGYGLSENTSVVAWTFPGPNVLGSVGMPLAHNEVRIGDKGRIEVRGTSVFKGYVSNGKFTARTGEWLNTGDYGYFDEKGCLHVVGRDSNLIVLSSGRNVSPEWIENKFKALPGVKEVLVFGHGKPFLSALVLVNEGYDCKSVLAEIERHSEKIKDEVPEFSQVRAFRTLPFDEQYYSVSGRVLRKQVLELQREELENIYSDNKEARNL